MSHFQNKKVSILLKYHIKKEKIKTVTVERDYFSQQTKKKCYVLYVILSIRIIICLKKICWLSWTGRGIRNLIRDTIHVRIIEFCFSSKNQINICLSLLHADAWTEGIVYFVFYSFKKLACLFLEVIVRLQYKTSRAILLICAFFKAVLSTLSPVSY